MPMRPETLRKRIEAATEAGYVVRRILPDGTLELARPAEADQGETDLALIDMSMTRK